MKQLRITFFFIVTFALTACVDDLIDREPQYNIGSENYFNSEQEYYDALIATYDILQSTYLNNILGEIASDNTLAGGESATDVIGWQQIDDMNHTPVNSELQNLWSWMYAGVNRANYILEFQEKTDFDGKEQLLAETRFLRAYYYFELVKWFGPVPLKETRFERGDAQTIPRSPVEEVYTFIENDLQYAVENLAVMAPQTGRATKGAAQALLGKVHLYQNEFSEAANHLEAVINSGNYSLVEDYGDIFLLTNENNQESVFEVQYTGGQGAGFGCLQCSEGNVAVGFMGVRNYDGPLFESGFSFNVPVEEVYNAFSDNDTRRDASILNIEAWAEETGATYGTGYEHTGYFNRKYLPRQVEREGDRNLTNPNNYRAIRYSDVLLMAAEALSRGDISDERARDYINQVRERAYGDNYPEVVESGDSLTEIILLERRLELVGEGHRFFDLVRTGRAADEIEGFVEGKHEVFPIPLEEIEFSNGNWEQNPNY